MKFRNVYILLIIFSNILDNPVDEDVEMEDASDTPAAGTSGDLHLPEETMVVNANDAIRFAPGKYSSNL